MTDAKPRRHNWAAYGAGVLLVIVAAFLFLHGRQAGNQDDNVELKPVVVEAAQAYVRAMETVVSAQGTLTPPQGGSVKVAVPVAGLLLSVTVREGDKVAAGQLLGTVDTRVQLAQSQSAAAALRVSQTQADQARIAAQAAEGDRASGVKLAQLELAVAETDLKKLQHGARPEELAQADQAVIQAKATRDRAATEVERVKFLFDKGVAAKRQLDDAETALSVADSALEVARQQASLTRAGARQEDLGAAQLRVKTAQANLQQARRGQLQVDAKKREAQAAVEAITQKQADLSAAQLAASYGELRAPIGGVVTRRNLNPGDMADPATPVLEIANSGSLNLIASVAADEGAQIRTGMPVRISTASSSQGAAYGGRVLSLGQIDPQTGLLTVRIIVANSQKLLRIGEFATASIIAKTRPGSVVVPKQAVINRNGANLVFTIGPDNVAHQHKVTTGVEQDSLVEIVSGIAPGDTVILLGQYEVTDGMKVQRAPKA